MGMEENKYEKKSSGNSSKTVLILLLLLIVAVAGYLFYSNSQKSNEISAKDEQIKFTGDTLAAKVKELEKLFRKVEL